MSLKAIIATILVGTSSVAVAAPVVRDHRTPQPLVVRDHRTLPPPVAPAPAPMPAPMPAVQRVVWHRPAPALQPVRLATSERLNGREIIKVHDSLRAFTKLELRSTAGRTKLDKILITFENGKTQTIECNRVLQGNESFTIDLAGNQRNLKRIVLVGKSGRRASLDVIAL